MPATAAPPFPNAGVRDTESFLSRTGQTPAAMRSTSVTPMPPSLTKGPIQAVYPTTGSPLPMQGVHLSEPEGPPSSTPPSLDAGRVGALYRDLHGQAENYADSVYQQHFDDLTKGLDVNNTGSVDEFARRHGVNPEARVSGSITPYRPQTNAELLAAAKAAHAGKYMAGADIPDEQRQQMAGDYWNVLTRNINPADNAAVEKLATQMGVSRQRVAGTSQGEEPLAMTNAEKLSAVRAKLRAGFVNQFHSGAAPAGVDTGGAIGPTAGGAAMGGGLAYPGISPEQLAEYRSILGGTHPAAAATVGTRLGMTPEQVESSRLRLAGAEQGVEQQKSNVAATLAYPGLQAQASQAAAESKDRNATRVGELEGQVGRLTGELSASRKTPAAARQTADSLQEYKAWLDRERIYQQARAAAFKDYGAPTDKELASLEKLNPGAMPKASYEGQEALPAGAPAANQAHPMAGTTKTAIGPDGKPVTLRLNPNGQWEPMSP